MCMLGHTQHSLRVAYADRHAAYAARLRGSTSGPESPRCQVPVPHCCPPATARPCSCDEPLRACFGGSPRGRGPRRPFGSHHWPGAADASGLPSPILRGQARHGAALLRAARRALRRPMSPAPPFLRCGWAGAAPARLPRAFRAPCAEKPPKSASGRVRGPWRPQQRERFGRPVSCALRLLGDGSPLLRSTTRPLQAARSWAPGDLPRVPILVAITVGFVPLQEGNCKSGLRSPFFGECFARKRVFSQRA